MINFDMVGRLKEDRLIVYGTKTADGIEAHLTQLDEEFSALKISQVPLGVPASDHISFYRKNIPSLHFFTGTHADYHMPTDDAEKINYAGMQLVVDFTEKLVDRYLDASDPPVFTAVKEDDPHAGLKIPSGPNTPYLGTSPDYGDEVEGVLLNGVRGGSPAAEGGLKAGDVIVSFDGHDIKNVRQYTAVLYAKKPGDKVKIAVLRGEGAGKERIELDITLGSRSKSQGE
jgi:membrane-associated protease RseP (regulator of RpoE activity)